jgi:hypothetical protein
MVPCSTYPHSVTKTRSLSLPWGRHMSSSIRDTRHSSLLSHPPPKPDTPRSIFSSATETPAKSPSRSPELEETFRGSKAAFVLFPCPSTHCHPAHAHSYSCISYKPSVGPAVVAKEQPGKRHVRVSCTGRWRCCGYERVCLHKQRAAQRYNPDRSERRV